MPQPHLSGAWCSNPQAIFAPTEEDDEAAAELAAAAPVEANGAGNDTLPVSAKVVRDVESDTQKQVEATHNEVPAVGAKRRRGGWARVLERAHTTKSEALTTLGARRVGRMQRSPGGGRRRACWRHGMRAGRTVC